MSRQQSYDIACPRCRHPQKVSLFESINVQKQPELRDLLLANKVNQVVCEQCGEAFRVDKPLLYHDPGHKFIVYLLPLSREDIQGGQRLFAEYMDRLKSVLSDGMDGPHLSLVISRTELIERIFLFEAGLNERIVEYIKYMIYSRNADRVDPTRKILLLDVEDSTPETLCFVVQDAQARKLESMMKFERKTYNALSEMFDSDEQTVDLLELFPGPYISARELFLREEPESAPAPAVLPKPESPPEPEAPRS